MRTRKTTILLFAVLGLLVALLPLAAQAAPPGRGSGGSGGCSRCGGGTATTPLSDFEKGALVSAVNEEYLALNTYNAVMAQLGGLAPFSMIANSEQMHVNAVSQLLAKYGLPVPGNHGRTFASSWSGLKAACQTGVDVETDDIHLYDTLLPGVSHADIAQVFTNLRSASLNCHLPRFEGCN